jgi:hypothetical protein
MKTAWLAGHMFGGNKTLPLMTLIGGIFTDGAGKYSYRKGREERKGNKAVSEARQDRNACATKSYSAAEGGYGPRRFYYET